MKTTQAFLIDPTTKTITAVSVGDYKDMQKQIKCGCFCTGGRYKANDLYVDDEGLFKEEQMFFFNPLFNSAQPLAGRGLVMGHDGQGNSADVPMSMETLMASTQFLGAAEDLKQMGLDIRDFF